MKIIQEVPWSHVLFELEGQWILTFMTRQGPIEYEVSIQMSRMEIQQYRKNEAFLEHFLQTCREYPEQYQTRQIMPSIWP
ncbi:hypothetical protein [Algicola sagamiensis]|uniref:hypothetical protein n=1 Tax=Algicola sagamiensis TaxID=163869 RepID=UPI00036BC134|nr:hypothetical protein [Algicola sagamiensis]